jgi:hypothetical protein
MIAILISFDSYSKIIISANVFRINLTMGYPNQINNRFYLYKSYDRDLINIKFFVAKVKIFIK